MVTQSLDLHYEEMTVITELHLKDPKGVSVTIPITVYLHELTAQYAQMDSLCSRGISDTSYLGEVCSYMKGMYATLVWILIVGFLQHIPDRIECQFHFPKWLEAWSSY